MKNKKSNKQLTDSDIINLYWEVFNKCEILDNGSIIKFNLTCFKGKKTLSYLVPIDYFLQWYGSKYGPHYIYQNHRWIDFNINKHKIPSTRNVNFLRFRRIMGSHAVKIYLSNKSAYVVPWDTVFMFCEKKYDQFGGWTKESKKITRKYFQSGRDCGDDTF